MSGQTVMGHVSEQRLRPFRWAAAVLVVSLGLTWVAWWHSVLESQDELQSDFERVTSDVTLRIKDHLVQHELVLAGFVGLFNAYEKVTRKGFQKYYESLRVLHSGDTFKAVGYHEMTPAIKLASHLAQRRSEGLANYQIVPGGLRDVYAPLVYFEPFVDANRKVLGFDPLTVPAERLAVERARDTDSVTISAKLTLEHDTGEPVSGFVMYRPLYKRGSTPGIQQRQANFVGWVDAPIRMHDLVAHAKTDGLKDIDLAIFDGEAMSPASLMFDASTQTHRRATTRLGSVQTLAFGGRIWTLAFSARPNFGVGAIWEIPHYIAGTGTLMSLLLSVLVGRLIRSHQRRDQTALRLANDAQREQHERSVRQAEEQARVALEQLRYQKTALDQHSIVSTTTVQGLITYVNDKFCEVSGYTREELIGQDHIMLSSGRQLKGFFKSMYQTIERGDVWQSDICNRAKDGHFYWIRATVICFADEDTQPTQYMAICNDISQRKATEMELELYRHHLEDMVREKTADLQQSMDALHAKESQRKQFESALSSSVALLHATLESTHEGIVVIDRESLVAQWNRRFIELWKVTPELVKSPNLAQLRAHMITQTAQPDEFMKVFLETDEHPEHSSSDLLRLADGRVFMRTSQPQIVGNEVVGRVWSYADITETELQKETLRLIEKRFELAVDGADIGIWDINFATGVVYHSPQMWQMLGYGDDEFTPSLATWEALSYPGDFAQVMDALLASLENPQHAVQLTTRYRHKDGSWHWVAVKGRSSANMDGQFTRVTGTHTDFTDRKKLETALNASQSNLRSLTNSVPGAVFQFLVQPTSRWKFIFVSRGVESLFEVPAGAVVAHHRALIECVFEQDLRDFKRSIVVATVTRCPWAYDVRIKTRSGLVKHVRGQATPKLRSDGSIVWNGILSDVTEIKRAEQAAQAANHAKSEFLANMSHEIRTPMNGVVGMIDIMQQTELNPDQLRMLGTIAQSSQALLNILNDILDYSKIEAGKLMVEHIATPLGDVATSVVQLMQSTANAKSIELSLWVSPELPHSIFSDPARLRQVLLNLVGNALKFTRSDANRSGHVALKVEPGTLADGTAAVLLRIIDNGIGISQEVVFRLFQPFTQADASTARRFGGTGLGLSISQRLVTLMGGQITVNSTLGQGSEFMVALPWLESQPSNEALRLLDRRQQARRPASSIEQALADKQLILLAEDNETNSDVLSEQLRLLGYACETATDGVIALEMWRTGRYALLLTDCHMPGMDGFGLTASIRLAEPAGVHLPIIAVTANAMLGEAQHCLESGMDDYLSKPLRLQVLGQMLNKWLPLPLDPDGLEALENDDGEQTAAKPATMAVWDAGTLGQLVGENPAMHERLLTKFLRNTTVQVGAIDAAVQAEQVSDVVRVAHTLKSAARMVGALALGELCQQIETAGKAEDADTCRALTAGLAAAFERVRSDIESSGKLTDSQVQTA